MAGGFIGAVLGVVLALLVGIPLAKIPMGESAQAFWQSLVLLFLAYLGLLLGLKKGEWFDPLSWVAYFRGEKTTTVRNFKILDTSVIIDGRTTPICRSRDGFGVPFTDEFPDDIPLLQPPGPSPGGDERSAQHSGSVLQPETTSS